MATGIITKHVHNMATKMFTVITRRANTKKDAIPTPKFPVSQKVFKLYNKNKLHAFYFFYLCS